MSRRLSATEAERATGARTGRGPAAAWPKVSPPSDSARASARASDWASDWAPRPLCRAGIGGGVSLAGGGPGAGIGVLVLGQLAQVGGHQLGQAAVAPQGVHARAAHPLGGVHQITEPDDEPAVHAPALGRAQAEQAPGRAQLDHGAGLVRPGRGAQLGAEQGGLGGEQGLGRRVPHRGIIDPAALSGVERRGGGHAQGRCRRALRRRIGPLARRRHPAVQPPRGREQARRRVKTAEPRLERRAERITQSSGQHRIAEAEHRRLGLEQGLAGGLGQQVGAHRRRRARPGRGPLQRRLVERGGRRVQAQPLGEADQGDAELRPKRRPSRAQGAEAQREHQGGAAAALELQGQLAHGTPRGEGAEPPVHAEAGDGQPLPLEEGRAGVGAHPAGRHRRAVNEAGAEAGAGQAGGQQGIPGEGLGPKAAGRRAEHALQHRLLLAKLGQTHRLGHQGQRAVGPHHALEPPAGRAGAQALDPGRRVGPLADRPQQGRARGPGELELGAGGQGVERGAEASFEQAGGARGRVTRREIIVQDNDQERGLGVHRGCAPSIRSVHTG